MNPLEASRIDGAGRPRWTVGRIGLVLSFVPLAAIGALMLFKPG
jgi:hypothetical protein